MRPVAQDRLAPVLVGAAAFEEAIGEGAGDLGAASANTPGWGALFTMPQPAGYPAINIGPWGRDYHHWLERLHAPYAFETLPCVLLAVIEAVAKGR